MRQGDVEQVYAIESSAFPSPWSKQAFVKELELTGISESFVVVDDRENVLGYLILRISHPVVHILNIAVKEDVRGCGIGTSLMKKAFQITRKYNMNGLFLEVRKSNTRAISLYRKFGFEVINRIKNYYEPDGEDALVMLALIK